MALVVGQPQNRAELPGAEVLRLTITHIIMEHFYTRLNHGGITLTWLQEAELEKVAAKLGRLKAEALNQLLDIFELPRGSGEEGHKVWCFQAANRIVRYLRFMCCGSSREEGHKKLWHMISVSIKSQCQTLAAFALRGLRSCRTGLNALRSAGVPCC